MIVMGMPLWAWIVFYVAVLFMLIVDLKMFGRKGQHEVNVAEAMRMTVVWIAVSLLFCVGIYFLYPVEAHVTGGDVSLIRQEKALEFLAGYLIEKSLSMDNLFVFLMLFSYFGIERKYQHEVLFWGIFGALVLRSIFIFAGAAAVERFEWVLGLFGVFLIYTGGKMFFHDEDETPDLSKNFIVRGFGKFFPVTKELHGEKFFIKDRKPVNILSIFKFQFSTFRKATPLFVALLVIETTDVAFAVDSIPAVFSVSRDPFIVLTSNIFAILGLRALYFALAAVAQYFKLLKYGLGVILVFVGCKMLLGLYGIEISTPVSLAVIVGVLALSVVFSLMFTKDEASPDSETSAEEEVSNGDGCDNTSKVSK